MAGIINSAQAKQFSDLGIKFTDYGGQQVITSDDFKNNLTSGAAQWNKSTGQSLSPMDYDKMLNPTTYGARWGVPADSGSATSTTPTGVQSFASNTGATTGQAVGAGYMAAQQAPAVSSDITKRVVDPTTETTEGRIQGIINSNSPLMQQAQAKALQQANDRGLGNSSLAVGAAQNAVLSAATPIANADAGVYGNAATLNTTTQNQFAAQKDATQNQINANNTGAINTAGAFTADAGNKASLQNASLATQEKISNADNVTKQLLQSMQSNSQMGVAQLSAQTQMALGNLDATTKSSLATLDAQNKQLLQTNTSAANLFNQTITNLTNISTSTTMDAAAKQAATDSQLTLLHQGMAALSAAAATKPGDIASLNLGQYFTPAVTKTEASATGTGGNLFGAPPSYNNYKF